MITDRQKRVTPFIHSGTPVTIKAGAQTVLGSVFDTDTPGKVEGDYYTRPEWIGVKVGDSIWVIHHADIQSSEAQL